MSFVIITKHKTFVASNGAAANAARVAEDLAGRRKPVPYEAPKPVVAAPKPKASPKVTVGDYASTHGVKAFKVIQALQERGFTDVTLATKIPANFAL